MKSKGITVWEMQVEKIVLAVAFVAFAYFTATQFIGNPNATTINNQTVAPGEVDGLLEERARKLSSQLAPEAPPTLELPEVKPIADTMLAALDDSISPVDTLSVPSYYTVPQGGGADVMQPQLYAVPNLIAPAPTYPKQYSDALTAEVVSLYADELAGKFEPGKPYDLTYVTFHGELDLAHLRAELQKQYTDQDTGEVYAQIPSAWYGGKPLILDLVIERGEVEGDQLVNIVTLDPLPGQYTFRDWMGGELTVNDRNTMLEELLKPEVQGAIIQPEFLDTRRGSWQPLMLGELEEQEEVIDDPDDPTARLDRLIRRTQAEIERINTQLTELGGPLDEGSPGAGGNDDSSPRGGNTGGSRGPGKGDGGGGGGMVGRPGGPGGDDISKKRRIALTKKLRLLEERLASYQEERTALQGAVLVEEVEDEGPQDRIMVWGHDINVEPGKTYRYRMKIKLLNPFFARKLNLKEAQQHLADQVALESPFSEWSEVIDIDPSVRIFLTGARAAAQGGRDMPGAGFGTATFQVFKFYDGLTWQQDFTVEPGDRIGDTRSVTLHGEDGSSKKTDIDFRTNWLVVDIIKDHEASSSGGALSAGMEAYVVLMDIRTGEITELRDPREDRFSTLLEELRQEVKMSEVAAMSP